MAHSKNLRVAPEVYERRKRRMLRLIVWNAPPILVCHEARLILAAWRPSLYQRFRGWLSLKRVGLAALFSREMTYDLGWDRAADNTEQTKTVILENKP